MSSAEKKRIRDRRAQQALRAKKLHHTKKLEEKLTYCEQYHSDQGAQQLHQIIEGLRRQNETLIARQEQLKSLVRSWDIDAGDLGGNSTPRAQPTEFDPPTVAVPCSNNGHGFISIDNYTTPKLVPDNSLPPIDSCLPWRLLPLNNDDFFNRKDISCPWFFYPEKVITSPDVPSSPLDILYGTRTNPLADMISIALRRRPIRDPERLAMGWIFYLFSKWLVSPNPVSYTKLPEFMRPVLDQAHFLHPMSLDLITWPTMRLNLIRNWHFYKERMDEIFGLLTCCMKVRWPWGESTLERNEQNELCIKKSFYETFMNENGWGLTPEFIQKYPDITAGLHIDTIVYKVA
jgi:hypothetical protein